MRPELIDLLECPQCASEKPLAVDGETGAEGTIERGELRCTACGARYPILDGIPRFVAPEENYCGNFGYQWRQWRTLQIDRLSGHTLSEDRFLADSRWPSDWFAGKRILDAGCGAGRFADIAAKFGAHVVAIDISEAVDACRETTSFHDIADGPGQVDCLQASLFELPLRKGAFDAVYCMGVIQHTPDPMGLMRLLPGYLKPGGRLVYNFYEEGVWRRLQVIKYGLRLITPHLSIDANLTLAKALVGMFYPLTRWLSEIPKIRVLNHFIPIAAVHDAQLTPDQQRAWTLLDTFDWYGARFEKRQHHDRVAALLKETGMNNVHSQSGLAWAEKPATD